MYWIFFISIEVDSTVHLSTFACISPNSTKAYFYYSFIEKVNKEKNIIILLHALKNKAKVIAFMCTKIYIFNN